MPEKSKSKLKEFTQPTARPLPVILLADISGSMSVNGKIGALNLAAWEMVKSFAEEDDSRAEIHVAVITFGGSGAMLHLPLTPAAKVSWPNMNADGFTPLGEALALVTRLIEDKAQIPSRAYRPTIVLVSDGQPTDDWENPLKGLLASGRASKASRFALAIGDDADEAVLSKFLASPEARVFHAHEARDIAKFFRFITMSVTSRTRSTNPDVDNQQGTTNLDALDF